MIEVIIPTTDELGIPVFAVVAFDSWANIGGTAEVVQIFGFDAMGYKEVLGEWSDGTERKIVRELCAHWRKALH